MWVLTYGGHFGEGVGAEGRNHQQIGPFAQVDMQNGISSLVPGYPLIAVVVNGYWKIRLIIGFAAEFKLCKLGVTDILNNQDVRNLWSFSVGKK